MSKLDSTIRISGTEGCPLNEGKPSIPTIERQDIPGCILESVIGVGGMGTVYLGKQLNLNRRVAIKVLRKEYLNNPQLIEQIRREAQISGKLSHPNLVSCHDVIITSNSVSVIMEYIPGHMTARDIVHLLGPMPEHYVIHVMLGIARALAYAYEKGYTHCDVKPGNILFAFDDKRKPRNYDELFHTPASRIALCDFGIAYVRKGLEELSEAEKTPSDFSPSVMGTPLYMAPEQALHPEQVDCRCDIYALGSTAYYLLTGKVPFNGSTWDEVLEKKSENDIPSPQRINKDISSATCRIIARMGACLPENRYLNYSELLGVLERQEALNNENAPLFVGILYRHHRLLCNILSIILSLMLLIWLGTNLYTRWLEENAGQYSTHRGSISRWDGATSTWKTQFDPQSKKQILVGESGSGPLILRQLITPGDKVIIQLRCSGLGRINMTLLGNTSEPSALVNIHVQKDISGNYSVGMHSPTSAGAQIVPMPIDFPDRCVGNANITLTLLISADHVLLENGAKPLGIAHYTETASADGLLLRIERISTDTSVVFSRIAVLRAK